ncbi:MAG: hypothetical protein Q9224_007310, partial [Gallowayella concinna]
ISIIFVLSPQANAKTDAQGYRDQDSRNKKKHDKLSARTRSRRFVGKGPIANIFG